MRKRHAKYIGVIAVIAAALFLLASCGQGISLDEAEAMKADLEQANSRIAAIESSLMDLQSAGDDEVASAADAAREELNMVASTLADLVSQIDIPEPAPEEPMGEPMEPQGF